MGTNLGQHLNSLIEDLKQNAPSYNVWQAVFLSEKISKRLHPERKDFLLDQTGITFRPFENYIFPPKDIHSVTFLDNNINFILTFMGLYGINSPLPRCYHEQVAMQQSIHGQGEVPLQNFLDIFNNRFYWLYFQAWKKYRFYLQLGDNTNNKIMQRVHAFIGKGPTITKEQTTISRFTLLKFSGFLTLRVRSRACLMILLLHIFPQFKIEIEEFVSKWVKLTNIPKLGYSEEDNEIQLGNNSIIGKFILDYMSRICIVIGPITYEDYLDFTPKSPHATRLKELLDLYLNDGLEYDIKFIINSESIVSIGWNDERLRLGSTIWLGKPKKELIEVYYPYEEFMK